MAVPFNGVLISREAGSLMPSTIIDGVAVQDCKINSVKLDSGDERIDKADNGVVTREKIVSDPANLPILPGADWSLETEFYANFNGDLEAGPVSFYGKEIDGMAIRRSSNRTAFTKWEDIKIISNLKSVIDENSEISFRDKTVESGIWYMYAAQPMSGEERGSLCKSKRRAVIYDDAFLVGDNGKQLKLKYDFSISSVKRNIKEARVETLGSKYPFITRNGSVDYKEFSITGLITHFMDETKEFAPEASLFVNDEFAANSMDISHSYKSLYSEYDLNDYNNTVLEREFREKVSSFLYDGKPKLFKGTKERSTLVRLMDVNLTPKQEINGGMIYTFSCNAIEVGSADIENLDKYNIQKR